MASGLLARGMSPSAAAKEVARRCGLARSAAYDLVVSLKA
ncbi:helix-turn-helix domain-containing protein [Olsenella sp. CU969]